jgi:hypothetical protein
VRRLITWTLIVGGVLCVVLLISSLTSLGDGRQASAKGSEGSHVTGIGERVVLNDIAFTITHAGSGKRLPTHLGQTPRYWAKAKGIFIRVSISFTNVGAVPATGTITDSTFFGSDGKTYGLDSSRHSTFSDLTRGFLARGWLVFDVSPNALQGGRLVLLECMAPLLDQPIQRCATARIDLGLR